MTIACIVFVSCCELALNLEYHTSLATENLSRKSPFTDIILRVITKNRKTHISLRIVLYRFKCVYYTQSEVPKKFTSVICKEGYY